MACQLLTVLSDRQGMKNDQAGGRKQSSSRAVLLSRDCS